MTSVLTPQQESRGLVGGMVTRTCCNVIFLFWLNSLQSFQTEICLTSLTYRLQVCNFYLFSIFSLSISSPPWNLKNGYQHFYPPLGLLCQWQRVQKARSFTSKSRLQHLFLERWALNPSVLGSLHSQSEIKKYLVSPDKNEITGTDTLWATQRKGAWYKPLLFQRVRLGQKGPQAHNHWTTLNDTQMESFPFQLPHPHGKDLFPKDIIYKEHSVMRYKNYHKMTVNQGCT